MGAIVGFIAPRKPRAGFSSRRPARPWTARRAKGKQSWRQAAAWLPAGFLIGIAAGFALIGAGGETPAFLTGTAEAPRTPMTGSGEYRLCGNANRSNCVIDGDTLRYGGVKVRLADIDAPEIFSPKCASEAALGQRATQRLVELMSAGPFEVVRSGGRDEDIYGRKLRVIERGGRSVGDTLVAEGLARRWDGARRSWCG
jgi:endonuclease YncB( thermonuclease family)